MQKNQSKLIALTGIAILVLAGLLMSSRQTAAQAAGAAPVTIVGPLPLPVTGSSTVSGTVAATQSGAWNVGISGTPLFRNAGEPGRAPYQSHVRNSNPGGLLTVSFGTVPAGHRLVIEHFSYFATAPSCSRISFDHQGFLGEDTTSTWLLPAVIGSSLGTIECSVNIPIRAYADAGQAPGILVPGNLSLIDATLAGYLIDCTADACAGIAH